MAKINKKLLRLAIAIHGELALLGSRSRSIELPTYSWGECEALVRKIKRAEMRGWQLAAQELRADLGRTIPAVQAELVTLAAQLPRARVAPTPATDGDVYGDLVSLEMEFDEVAFDLRECWLSVTTEPITLHGVYLGPFEIRLNWSRATGDSPYRVIAHDPHPPDGRENVTHPHVMDENLCEGHSRQAIRQALTQGRLLDFFTLIANGLRTYNEESPFVALEIWHGSTCSDCGAVMDEDEGYTCQRCEETVCESCEVTCRRCDEYFCSQCTASCSSCAEHCCRRCLQVCQVCRRSVCLECIAAVELEPAQAIGRTLARQALHFPKGMAVNHRLVQQLQGQRIHNIYVHDERCLACHEEKRQQVGIAPREDLLFVEDVALVKQACTWASAEFDAASVADFFDAQVDAGRHPEEFFRLFMHTHPGSSPQPSLTDEETFARVFGRTDWAVMFILARGGQGYARLRYNVGPGIDVELPVEVDYSRPFEATDFAAWHAEYLAKVEVPPPEPTKKGNSDEQPSLALQNGNDWLVDDWWRESWDEYANFEHYPEEGSYGFIRDFE